MARMSKQMKDILEVLEEMSASSYRIYESHKEAGVEDYGEYLAECMAYDDVIHMIKNPDYFKALRDIYVPAD